MYVCTCVIQYNTYICSTDLVILYTVYFTYIIVLSLLLLCDCFIYTPQKCSTHTYVKVPFFISILVTTLYTSTYICKMCIHFTYVRTILQSLYSDTCLLPEDCQIIKGPLSLKHSI